MISHQYKCIFIHIPKCAGTSISTALGHFEGHSGRGGQDYRSIRMIEKPFMNVDVFSSTDNLSELFQRGVYRFRSPMNPNSTLTVTAEQYNNYFKFAFVRNPWGRAFSWYKNVMQDEFHRKIYGINEDISLNKFLRIFINSGALAPQTNWLKDFSGTIPLDFIGHFENLHEDFKKVCKLLGIDSLTLSQKNIGTGEDYRNAFDKESIEMIREAYKIEIKKFNYTY